MADGPAMKLDCNAWLDVIGRARLIPLDGFLRGAHSSLPTFAPKGRRRRRARSEPVRSARSPVTLLVGARLRRR